MLLQIASLLLSKRPTSFRACFEMEHEFCSPTPILSRKATLHRTRRVHLSIEDEKVTVELIQKANCSHDADVFIPDPNSDALGRRAPTHGPAEVNWLT